MNQKIKITLDPMSIPRLKQGDVYFHVRISDLSVLDSGLIHAVSGNRMELDFTPGDIDFTQEEVVSNWDDNLNYQPVISCDDEDVHFGYLPGEKGEWTIMILEEPGEASNIYDEYMYVMVNGNLSEIQIQL